MVPKSVIIDFNHIPKDLGNPKLLKSLYCYHHKIHYCYSYQYKILRRRKIGLSVLRSLLSVTGSVVGKITVLGST